MAEELEADIGQSFLPDFFDPPSGKSEARIHGRSCIAALVLDYVSLLTSKFINRSLASERVLLEAVVYSYAQRPRRVLVSDTYLTHRRIKQLGHQRIQILRKSQVAVNERSSHARWI